MQVVLVVLALVGAVVVAKWFIGGAGRTSRVLRAANSFQTTSIEAVEAIRQRPPDEDRQFRALRAWEDARAFVASLSPEEQRIALETLRDRSFPVAKVGEAITAFVEMKDGETRVLDEQLGELMVDVRQGARA